MKLDSVSVELRPRPPWEAIDLGIRLGQSWWRPIVGSWLLLVLPFMILTCVLCGEHWLIATAIIWWFKPVYERLPLIVVSRGLFGDPPSTWGTIRELIRTRFVLRSLTLYRFSLRRSYGHPVLVLEGHNRGSLRKRLAALSTPPGATASLTVCFLIEQLTLVGMFFLFLFFLPQGSDEAAVDSFSHLGDPTLSASTLFIVVFEASYAIAVSIVAICYALAGFGLYINRRTYLEGWDIEVTFKALRQRLLQEGFGRVALLLLALVLLTVWSAPTMATAQETNTDPAIDQTISRVLEHPDFERRTETRVRYKRESSNDNENSTSRAPAGPWLGALFAIVSYSALAIFVVVLLGVFIRGLLQRNATRPSEPDAPDPLDTPVREIFDLSDLPQDVLGAARSAWQQNDPKSALSLLYRGSLAYFSDAADIVFHQGDTESICVEKVRAGETSGPNKELFRRITHAWMGVAYANLQPDNVETLLDDWSRAFGRRKR